MRGNADAESETKVPRSLFLGTAVLALGSDLLEEPDAAQGRQGRSPH
jgi:hypothetical protein